ncbi:hypothetical protein [Acrocarpospora catenulata]|uniref:hypothetical protein n=1 Tax=Acrocarpospora catenulata TaxID=2836182 RepID=UPI001BD91CF7|nr:hypothetical protein [Acrocarpospora catenulata]
MAQRAKLRQDRFVDRAREIGLVSQVQQAQAIRTHPSIHCRALKGARELSGSYVLGVLLTVGDNATRELIDDLFELPDA